MESCAVGTLTGGRWGFVPLAGGGFGEVGAQKKIKSRYRTAKALFVIGAGGFLWGLTTLYTAWNSRSWPTADGKISYSNARTGGRNHRLLLWYEYNVRGTRYIAENYRVGGNSSPFKDVIKAAAGRYPVGRNVTVYYTIRRTRPKPCSSPACGTATSFLPGSDS